jgi:hypothetical protein
MKYIAKERSDDEKKEIYDKWKSLINMSEKELKDWGKDPDHLEASLNREEAKDNGKIQSGYDSFHRIKRRKDKPFEDWTAQDFDNASQENGFNGRMLGGNPGKPVGSTGMSKWEISLRNWGHDPSKPNSPSHTKWKKWKKENEEEIKMSLTKKKKANLILDLYKMSFKVKGGENLRRACLMCLNTKQANAMTITPELIDSLPEEKQEQLKFDVLVAHLDQVKNDVISQVKMNVDIVKSYLIEKGLFNGKNIVSAKLKKPVNIIQKAIVQILNSFVQKKDIYSLFRFTSALISAKTPEEIASLTKVSLLEVREILQQESLYNKQIEKTIDVTESSNEAFVALDNTKFFAVNGLFALGKVILVKVVFFGAPIVGVILHLMPMIGGLLLMAILTDASTTANLVKKFGIATTVIPAVLIARLIPHLKLAYNKISDVLVEAYTWAKNKTMSLFDRKQEVLSEAIKLASTNPVFYRMLEERLC